MFQSFPLGDRSSVNLRGEYHVENVTMFESVASISLSAQENSLKTEEDVENPEPIQEGVFGDIKDTKMVDPGEPERLTKSVAFEGEPDKDAAQPDMDTLYPVFWSLQANFSNPTRLFEETNFTEFKRGLQLTLNKLQSIYQDSQGRGSMRPMDEGQRGLKRKRGEQGSDLSASFNPKYLTSRDLFELEV